MKQSRLTWTIAGVALVPIAAGAALVMGARDTRVYSGRTTPAAAAPMKVLPAPSAARQILSTTPRHIEWVAAPLGDKRILAFVVSPERSDAAPVVMISAQDQGASDWARAVADRVAAAGFIAVVPDVLTGEGPGGGDTDAFRGAAAVPSALARLGASEISRRFDAVQRLALAMPASRDISVRLDLNPLESRINTVVGSGPSATSAQFPLTDQGFLDSIAYLRVQTKDHPVFSANTVENEHAMHLAMMAKPAATGEVGHPGQPGGDTSYYQKRPDLPADFYSAKSTIAKSKLRKEFVEIPLGDVKLRTWVEYPEGTGKVGTVIVMQHGTGMDVWVQGVADQLAQSGFIAVAADVWSGTGPGPTGGLDSFQYLDDAMKASAKISPDEMVRRYKAARDYALKLPRSNGKTASLGFCMGGSNSFRFAGEVPELNGAVVFYGGPPDDSIMQKIQSPVLGFYGENDARVTAAVEPTVAKMKSMGKSYEPHIYPKTTHSFVLFQEVAGNPAAVRDAWPRAIAFLKKQLASN